MITAKPEDVGFSSKRLNSISKFVNDYVSEGKLSGVSTMIARHGQIISSEQHGMADIAAQKPIKEDTIFRIYSMTKPITSVAIMMLYEKGKFALDDPVGRFIPELSSLKVFERMSERGIRLKDQKTPITIRHLLSHTSGLSYGHHQDSPVDEMYRNANITDPDTNLKTMIEKISKIPLVNHPGTKWRYSNATDVLGYLIEILSGTSFDTFLRQNIFKPLNMLDTDFYISKEKIDRLATVYSPGINGTLQPLESDYVQKFARPHTLYSGGGGLTSTIADYMKFSQMLLNGGEHKGVRLLSPKTIQLMTLDQLTNDLKPFAVSEGMSAETKGCGFGLGFRIITDLAHHGVIGSEGIYSWGGAASTIFWNDPSEDLTAILMTQMMPSSAYPIRRQFQIAVYQALMN